MQFSLEKKSRRSAARAGTLRLRHGTVRTPYFMPIATRAAVKTVSSDELAALGAQMILSNTYHLQIRPGTRFIQRAGGLHQFMGWDKPILTDSGGYQVFSLTNHRRVADRGVAFTDPEHGTRSLLTPENVVKAQLELGVDIAMVLDECPPYPVTEAGAAAAVARTTAWARRARRAYRRAPSAQRRGRGLFGIVQGSTYQELRVQSARDLVELDFDGYAIGGVAVGEPRQYLTPVLEWVMPELPAGKPRYLMGLGRPEEIVTAVQHGIDLFDCVIPTREGRHGRLFVWRPGRRNWTGDWYEMMTITNAKWRTCHEPINRHSRLPLLRRHTRAYLHHLFRTNETLGWRLASLHNLEFYLDLASKLRTDITSGKL